MPFYEYQCDACGHTLEALQKISEAPLSHCPQCGAAQLRKLISKAAFRLKGGGWYETDFKRSDQQRHVADAAQPNSEKNAESKDEKPGENPSAKPSDKSADQSATPTPKLSETPAPKSASPAATSTTTA